MKKIISLLLIIFIAAQAFPQNESPKTADKVSLENGLRKLSIAYMAIGSMYVDSVDVNKLGEDAIISMLAELDPHSSYTNAKETKRLNESLQGNFDGIGVQFNILDDTLLVIQPVPGGPSEQVGILAGDRITAVDDTAIAGVKMSKEEMMRRLRGPKGTQVKLEITRHGLSNKLSFTVTRDKIPTFTVDAAFMLDSLTGLIRLSSFGSTSHDEIVEAINKLKAEGMQNLILDLQQNGGGYMEAATKIANEFLQPDDLIVYTKGLKSPYKENRAHDGGIMQSGKIIVLVDEYSASASEIVAGALQDHDRAVIMGRRTFGKGLVQKPFVLPDGSMIRLTVARYYTPSGRCIQKPYVKGEKETYQKDVFERLQAGELTSRDSIHLNDSLKFTTLRLGRTVYGGGGIMPDIFVPLDTTRYTRLARQLTANGCVISASLKYIDARRDSIRSEYSEFAQFKNNFGVPQDLIDLVLQEGEKNNVTPADEQELSDTMPWLRLQTKALLARDLWDMSAYFAILYQENPLVVQALSLIASDDYPIR